MFKNAFIFAFTKPFATTVEELTAAIQQHTFTPLGALEQARTGFTGVMADNGALALDVNGNVFINVRKQTKTPPPAQVKELLEERIAESELAQLFGTTKKQRDELKEDIIDSLLPITFKRTVDTQAYIDAESNFIVIDAVSRGKAEEVLTMLRTALGTLPVESVKPNADVNEVMTDWLDFTDNDKSKLSESFGFGTEAHFSTLNEDAATATVKNQDLTDSEVSGHIESGKFVTKIGLNTFKGDSFLLKDDLSLSKLSFSFTPVDSGNDEEDLIGDMAIMSGELTNIVNDLHAEFGIKATDSLINA